MDLSMEDRQRERHAICTSEHRNRSKPVGDGWTTTMLKIEPQESDPGWEEAVCSLKTSVCGAMSHLPLILRWIDLLGCSIRMPISPGQENVASWQHSQCLLWQVGGWYNKCKRPVAVPAPRIILHFFPAVRDVAPAPRIILYFFSRSSRCGAAEF